MSPRRPSRTAAPPEPAPVQAVERPILCSPYDEPHEHWIYRERGAAPERAPGRRPASYFFMTRGTGAGQISMFAEPERDDLPLVNLLRADVMPIHAEEEMVADGFTIYDVERAIWPGGFVNGNATGRLASGSTRSAAIRWAKLRSKWW